MKNTKGITLVALVITVIVLLILASISISTISGDNSLLNRAGKAKEDAERAELEEVLNKEYVKLETKSKYNSVANLDDAVEAVKNQGYDDKIVGVAGGGYKLNKEIVILSKTAPDNKDMLKIEEDTSASSGGTWYAVIVGRYFKIEENNEDIKIAKEPSNVDPNSDSSGDTINITSSDVTIANANIATFQVTASNEVTVTALETAVETPTTITISANGKSYSANIKVVGEIEQAPANLDGAIELLAATDTSNQNGANVELRNVVMTTSNPDVATVTTEGIVKCNKVDGETAIISAKQGETTRYFKVNSTATLATPTKMDSNKTINGQTTGTANNPIIPKDFYPVNTAVAKWTYDNTNNKVTDVDKGLVIMDEKGNQFVWVPVRDIKDMVMCANNNKAGHTCNIVFDGTNISCTAAGNSTEIVGKLYATEVGEKFKNNLDTTPYTYTKDSGLREPDAVTRYDNKQTQYTVDDRTTQLVKYKQMAISVAKNGGFYVGRYESSLINGTTRVVAGATSMSAKEDSANMWYGLYAKQNSYATENGVSSSVVSNMIWGSQYDAIMNWIGDLATSTISNNKNSDEARRTGSKATDKINNIFDLYGLRREWTMEAYTSFNRVLRGSRYYDDDSPSYRHISYPLRTYDYCSSRPALYIQ